MGMRMAGLRLLSLAPGAAAIPAASLTLASQPLLLISWTAQSALPRTCPPPEVALLSRLWQAAGAALHRPAAPQAGRQAGGRAQAWRLGCQATASAVGELRRKTALRAASAAVRHPPDQHLCRRLVVLLGEALHCLILQR